MDCTVHGVAESDMTEQLSLGLHGLSCSSLAVLNRGCSLVAVHGSSLRQLLFCRAWALGRVASVVAACGLQNAGSVVVVRWPSCPEACGIFPDQRLDLSPVLAGGFLTTEPPGKPLEEV